MLGCSLCVCVCVCEREREREREKQVSVDKISQTELSTDEPTGAFKVRKINVAVIACEKLHMCKTHEQNILQQLAV